MIKKSFEVIDSTVKYLSMIDYNIMKINLIGLYKYRYSYLNIFWGTESIVLIGNDPLIQEKFEHVLNDKR